MLCFRDASDLCDQQKFRSACAFAQPCQNLHQAWSEFSLAKGAKVFYADNEESDCAHAQADLSLRKEHISENTFAHIADQVWKFSHKTSKCTKKKTFF